MDGGPDPRGWSRGFSDGGELRSLGLCRGSGRLALGVYDLRMIPSGWSASSETFNTALDDFSNGRSEDALDKFSTVLADRPDFLGGASERRHGAHRNDRAEAAVGLLRDAPPAITVRGGVAHPNGAGPGGVRQGCETHVTCWPRLSPRPPEIRSR